MRCRAARRVSTDQQTTDNQRLGLERISLARLLGELTAAKAAAVAFMVATSANWRERTRACRGDIDPQSGWVHLRGTKRQMRDRRFIVAHPALSSLLRYAARHAPGEDPLFPPWANVRRDLLDAC